MGLEYFPFYHSYRKKCEKLTDQELGRLVRALLLFSETGETQELAGRESIAFDFISVDIENAHAAYDEKCAKNRVNRTGDNDRARPSTTDDGCAQNKTKTKTKEKIKPNSLTTPPTPPPAEPGNELGEVMTFFLDRINASPSPDCLDYLRQYTESLSAPVVLHAMQIALDEKKTGFAYIKAILARYEREGLRTLEAVKAQEQAREAQTAKHPGRMSKSPMLQHHEPKPVNMDELKRILDTI